MARMKTTKEEHFELAGYLEGVADSVKNTSLKEKLHKSALYLRSAGDKMCGQGVLGCRGGDNCDFEHK